MGLRNYILVTPCKNEEESLEMLIQSVCKQTNPPALWVIVDDGSTDKSPDIISKTTEQVSWIHSIYLVEEPRDLGIHVSEVYRAGFEYATSYCLKENYDYQYIGVVDADLYVEQNYFEVLINEFEKDSTLGIISGHVGNKVDGKLIWSDFREDLPNGGARLWSRKCFEETGGYAVTCSPDSVSNVKAMIHGWGTKQIKDTTAVSIRPYASAQGQWFGYKKLGSNNYYIGYSPFHIILKGIKLLYSKDGYTKNGVGIAYIYGYFKSYIQRKPQIEDEEILQHYGKKWLRKSICSRLQQKNKK